MPGPMSGQGITASLAVDEPETNLAVLAFVRAYNARGYRALISHQFGRDVPLSAVPERRLTVLDVETDHQVYRLVEVDDVLLLLRSWRTGAEMLVGAGDIAKARNVVEEVRSRLPAEQPGKRVRVRFTDQDTHDRKLWLDVRPWPEIRDLYPVPVAEALNSLVTHRATVAQGGRVLLWHGAAGTGKTSAIRALLYAWRNWADGTVVTDPDALLSNPRYLRRAVFDDPGEDRWQLLVLEDAEALLRRDVHRGGLAKLLNLTDGLLGQGLRCLFLITTNEPLRTVPPALLRPGRCLAVVEFTPLPASQAAALLGRPTGGPMTLAEVLAQRPLAVQVDAPAVGNYL
jgi:hypothetical protein